MREAIGGTWMMGIVVFFIVLFSGYLAISVNYSKAFKVKNGIIGIIEKNKGHNATAQGEIDAYLKEIGYYVYSDCSNKGIDRGTGFVSGTGGHKYCIKKNDATNASATLSKSYYTVTVFFKIDLPIIGDIFVFPVFGETKSINSARD